MWFLILVFEFQIQHSPSAPFFFNNLAISLCLFSLATLKGVFPSSSFAFISAF